VNIEEVNNYIEGCLADVSDKAIRDLAFDGGTFSALYDRIYDKAKYNYWCLYKNGR
jgi:hypothetical protein